MSIACDIITEVCLCNSEGAFMKRFVAVLLAILAFASLAAPAAADETPAPSDTAGEPAPTAAPVPYEIEVPDLSGTPADTYLIYVSKQTHTFAILAKDADGEYTKVVRLFITGLGKTAGMTRLGEYELTQKLVWRNWGNGDYSPYATEYSAGVWIHGPLYTAKNFDKLQITSYNKIGSNCSHGCLRTTCEAAAWVFYNCPVGTRVIVTNDSLYAAPELEDLDWHAARSDPTDPGESPEIPATSFELSVSEAELSAGDAALITVSAIYPAACSTESFVYTVDDPAVAAVSAAGEITAVGGGVAVITVCADDVLGMSRTVTVTVAEPVPDPVLEAPAFAATPTPEPEMNEEEVTVSVKLIQYLVLAVVVLLVASFGFAATGCNRTPDPVDPTTAPDTPAVSESPVSTPSGGVIDIVVPTPSPTPAPTPAPTQDTSDTSDFGSLTRDDNNLIVGNFTFDTPADVMVQVSNDCVRVRSLPTTDSDIVCWASLGQRMTATECVNGWLKVTVLPGMREGYMRSDYVVAYDPSRVFYAADRRLRVNVEEADGTTVVKVATLVDVRRVIPSINFYMVLAYPDNVYGRTLYGRDMCLLEKATCAKLARAQSLFLADGYSIKLYDAYRPSSISGIMYSIVPNGTYVAPAERSKHNRGVAVDMTLVDRDGNELEMPSTVMDLSSNASRSNPNMSETARENMNYMTSIMRKCGFTSYSAEWWHFQDSNADDYPATDVDLVRSVTMVEFFPQDQVIDGGIQ